MCSAFLKLYLFIIIIIIIFITINIIICSVFLKFSIDTIHLLFNIQNIT